jgi:acetolactate decarboxylase
LIRRQALGDKKRSAMPKLTVQISQSLLNALEGRLRSGGESASQVVSAALSQYLGIPQHTLFQISTTGALVQGIYERAVSSTFLLRYGDFGLGTFENLDGEMVVLDGIVFQVRSDGSVSRIVEDVGTPFAVVLKFVPDMQETIPTAASLQDLTKICDQYRDSSNLFYAFRVDGRFEHVHTRAMRATTDGLPLAKAAAIQPEFDFHDVAGTLVGIWAPQFSRALNVAGYHFHFLSDDRTKGGHLLECKGTNLRMALEKLNEFHLSLPETEEFLKADLAKDTSQDLAYAEQMHKKDGT